MRHLLGGWDSEKGPQLIAALREQRANLPVIVLSESDTVSVAVEAMRAGASDFLVRPVAPERLLEALAANADRRRAAGELAPVSEKLAPPLALEQLIGAAPEFRAALAVAAKSARNRLPVLIIGEPGTGKETVARAIHSASLRAKGPLLTLDCKAIAANIIDSELFGHEKGRLPGRVHGQDRQARPGRRRHAGARRYRLPARADPGAARPRARHRRGAAGRPQRQLFGRRASHRHEQPSASRGFRPRAGRADRRDHRQLAAAARTQRRHPLPRPPPAQRLAEQTGLKALSIGNDALAVLMRYGWPGNVRQLAGVLFRAAPAVRGSSLTAQHFPHIAVQSRLHRPPHRFRADISQARSDEAIAGAPGVTLYTGDGHLRPLEEIEADIIRLAIGHYRGRMTEVARRLGIGRSTLYRKLGELGIDTAA